MQRCGGEGTGDAHPGVAYRGSGVVDTVVCARLSEVYEFVVLHRCSQLHWHGGFGCDVVSSLKRKALC